MTDPKRNEHESASRRFDLRRALICLLLSGLCFGRLAAQESRYAPLPPIPLGDLLLTLPTSHAPAAGTFEVRFSHRFNQSLDQGSGSERLHSLFGLDGSADVAIGLSYAATRDLQLSLLRSNALDDIELAAKYIVVEQAPAIPFSLAVRGGTDIRTEKGLDDRTSVFGQAIVSRRFGRTEVFALPSFVTNGGRASGSGALFRNAFNVPFGAAFLISPSLSLVGELTPENRDLPSGMHGDPAWAIGLKHAIGGHFFEVLLTDSNATHVDQYVTGTYQGAPLRRGDIHLGFNIERRFGK